MGLEKDHDNHNLLAITEDANSINKTYSTPKLILTKFFL